MININLIPSESYINKKILFNIKKLDKFNIFNKYMEGEVGKRYYKGLEKVDKIITQYKDKIKQLTKFKYVNIQPLSGAIANFCILKAFHHHLLLEAKGRALSIEPLVAGCCCCSAL